MAQGDFTWFNAAKRKLGLAVVNLETDVIKLGLITDAVTPTASTADPCWGAGGTTNLSSSQVTPGGNYASGGPTVANNAFTESSGTVTFDGDAVSIAQNASNPTDARWGVLYSDTATAKDALGFLDLGGVTDLSAGGFSATPNAAGIMTLA
jgi:hypothetical protein